MRTTTYLLAAMAFTALALAGPVPSAHASGCGMQRRNDSAISTDHGNGAQPNCVSRNAFVMSPIAGVERDINKRRWGGSTFRFYMGIAAFDVLRHSRKLEPLMIAIGHEEGRRKGFHFLYLLRRSAWATPASEQ